jgi:hypothetical protein
VVKNLALAAGGAPATTSRLYLSNDATLDVGTDTELGDVAVGALAGGAMVTLPKTVAIPGGTAPGPYWIIAQANATNTVQEVDSPTHANNWRATPIIIGPDLVVAAATGPTLTGPGVSFPVTTTIKNQGGQVAGPSVVTFHLAQTGQPDVLLSASRSVSTLAPGAISGPLATTVTIPANTSAGTYFIKVQADGLGAVDEADETNNSRATTAINVQRPDLRVMSITAPTAAIRGKIVGAPSGSVVVKNLGPGPSAPFDVQVFANRDEGPGSETPGAGDMILVRTVPTLAPGAQTTISGPIVVPESVSSVVRLAGNYYVSAIADPTGATSDPVLGNNALTLLTKVPVLPDMSKLQNTTVVLSLTDDCGVNNLNLQGPFTATSQTATNPSTFRGTMTLDDTVVGFHQVYNVTGTVRAIDLNDGTAGKVVSSFTYTATINNDFASNGSGDINGAAPALNLTGGSISGRQSNLPTCTFVGSIDIDR